MRGSERIADPGQIPALFRLHPQRYLEVLESLEVAKDEHLVKDIDELVRRFTGSYTATDIDPNIGDLFAPTMTVRHNYDANRTELPGAMYAKGMMWKVIGCTQRVKNYVDKLDHVIVTDDKVVVAATATGTMPDGSLLKIPRCTILTIENGLIAHVDSYSDHAHSGPLDELLPYEEMFAAIAE